VSATLTEPPLTPLEEHFVEYLLAPNHHARGDWRRISEVLRRQGVPLEVYDRIFRTARTRLMEERRARDAVGGTWGEGARRLT
jgi:hypothetical protein